MEETKSQNEKPIAENNIPKQEPIKAEHTFFKDIQNLFTSGTVKESENIFRMAREHEVEGVQEIKEQKTNQTFLIAGLVVLCIAIVIAGYAITRTKKQLTATPSALESQNAPFFADTLQQLDMRDMRTFEKKDAWQQLLKNTQPKKTTLVKIVPTATLPDIFSLQTDTTKLAGIETVYVGVNNETSATPFIVATIKNIDDAHTSVQEHISEIGDGLTLFFGYTAFSATERANLTTEDTLYQNQPMTEVFVRQKITPSSTVLTTPIKVTANPVPDIAPPVTTGTAEDILQSLVASVDIPSTITNESMVLVTPAEINNQVIFAYAFVRQKYLIIAPTKQAIIEIIDQIGE